MAEPVCHNEHPHDPHPYQEGWIVVRNGMVVKTLPKPDPVPCDGVPDPDPPRHLTRVGLSGTNTEADEARFERAHASEWPPSREELMAPTVYDAPNTRGRRRR